MEESKNDPKLMRALVLEEFGKPPVFKMVPIPVPKSGQVLIKMEASPINPSDLAFIKGVYSSQKVPPCIPGFEGSGTVIQNGGGFIGWSVMGKRVAVALTRSVGLNGCYAEYCVADSNTVVPIPNDVTFNQAASTFVNPLTVLGMLEVVQQHKITCVIHTAAASALGRMMVRYFQSNGVSVINVVRREEQIEILKKEGAQIILNQTDKDFDKQLQKLAKDMNAKICFDAVGGELTGIILDNMPNGSTVYVYGILSMKPCQVGAGDLIFKQKTVTGFWLTQWLQNKTFIQQMFIMNKLKGLLKTLLKTEVSKEFSIEEGAEAIKYYIENMSKGKVLIKSSVKPQLQQM